MNIFIRFNFKIKIPILKPTIILNLLYLSKIKVISVLKTFTRKELSAFGDFLNSPYFNKGRKYITRFYKELIKYHPGYDRGNFIKKEIYSKLYPSEEYDDERFRKLLSELYKLVMEFLAAEDFLSAELNKADGILTQLKERKLNNLFELELKKSYEELNKFEFRNDNYNKTLYELSEKEKFFYFQGKRSTALNKYDSEMECFTKYFLSLLLAKYIERAMEKRFFRSKDFKLPMFGEVLNYIEKSDYIKDPLINILYLELKLCLSDDDESYYRLKKLLYKEEKRLDKNQLGIIYKILSNYAVERSEKGMTEFQKEILSLNLEIIKKNLVEQYISPFLFVNIITLSLKFKRIRQLDKFIKENSDRLNPEIKDTVLSYCNSYLAFYQKNYDYALSHLSKINFDHYQLRFQIKNLTLKIYYEQNQFESVFSLIDSYKHILKRETAIPESIRKTISAFLKFINVLSELKSGKKKSEKVILLKEIFSSQPAEKSWLLEKINEL